MVKKDFFFASGMYIANNEGMDKVTSKNIEINMSDKMQNYLSDLLKTMSPTLLMPQSQAVSLEKSGFGKEEKKSGAEDHSHHNQLVIESADDSVSEVVLEEKPAQLYENFVKNGQVKMVVSKAQLLSMLDEVQQTQKQSGTEAARQVPLMVVPTACQTIEDRKALAALVDTSLEEDAEADDQDQEEDAEEDDEKKDDGSMTLKEFKTLYLKI